MSIDAFVLQAYNYKQAKGDKKNKGATYIWELWRRWLVRWA